MLTPGGTALRRIRQAIRFQYRVWRMAVDWTVALYLVVPGLFFIGYQYVTWYSAPPVWMEHVPYALMRGLLFVFAAGGTLRLYVEEADQLFLVQRVDWFRRMMSWGMGFSIAAQGGWTLALAGGMYPLLSRIYGLTPGETVELFVLVFLFKLYLQLGNQWLSVRLSGWRGVLVKIVMLPPAGLLFAWITAVPQAELGGPYVFAAAMAVIMGAPLVWLLPARLRLKGAFFHDIRREHEEKMKVAGLLMGIAGIPAPKKTKLRRKKPLLFPGSGKLFRARSADHVLAESLIKAAFRTGSKLKLMGYGGLAFAMAVGVSPAGGFRVGVLLAVSLMNVYMASGFAKEGAEEGFIRMFHWEDGVRFGALQKAGLGISLPVCLLLAGLTGMLEQGGWGALLYLPLGFACAWTGAWLFGIWGGNPGRE